MRDAVRIRAVRAALAAAVLGASTLFAEPPAPPPAAEGAQPAPAATPEPSGPHLVIRGFTDINYAVNDERRPNTFSLGQIDLFMTSALSETLSVLAEVAFEFEEDGDSELDVERIQVRYAPSDLFTLSAGRMHTPLGYWNQTYHHGRWFQTTAERPQMYLFEDDGGILPIHEVGLQAAGTLHGRALDVKYSVSVVNGRGGAPDQVTTAQDPDASKAVNLLLGLIPSSPRGLELGVNAYLDTIAGRLEAPAREALRETILGAYGVYVQSRFELLAEGSWIRHRGRVGGETFESYGLYGQGAVRFGSWKPYYRFERVKVAGGDPFLPPRDLSLHIGGLRFDPSAWLGLRAEYHLSREHGEDVHSALAQAAFAF